MIDTAGWKGWARHRTFGLRSEWLELFLHNQNGWQRACNLGSKQIVSLHQWLQTMGIRQGNLFHEQLIQEFKVLGVRDEGLWSLSWANIVFSWPTARLYVIRNYEEPMSAKDMVADFMQLVHTVTKRTIYDGVLELFGLCSHTPVGSPLGQGIVSSGVPRTIKRTGTTPPTAASMHTLIMLFKCTGSYSLPLEEKLLWPWTVFGCEKDEVLSQLIAESCDWLELTSNNVVCKDVFKGEYHVMGLLGLHRSS